MNRTRFLNILFGIFFLAEAVPAQQPNSPNFGFRGLEIFKLEQRSQGMVSGDFNSDGRQDLLLIDNSHSRLDLLLQRSEKPEKEDPIDTSDVNAVKYDWRFEHVKVPVDKEVFSLAVGDFNHDGKDDIAYFGVPDRLIVRTQSNENDWPELFNLRLADVSKASWLVAAGDLNHDDKEDLVVLGKTETYLLYQQEGGKFATPQTVMNTSDNLALAHVGDLNGDGLNDLCYTADDQGERALCVRLQTFEGRLGPEFVYDLHKPRSVTLGDFDGKPGKEIFVVDSRTNRVNVFQIQRPEDKTDNSLSRLIQYGLGESGSGRDREMATGDIDGDSRLDVVVTDPSAARLLVFRQQKNQGLDSGTSYPALVGTTQVRIAQFGPGQASVMILSPREKTLGVSKFEDGRLTFPTAIPLDVEPLAFEITDLDGDGEPEVFYVGEKENSPYRFAALKWTNQGWKSFQWGDKTFLDIQLDSEPERLKQLDANQDGRPDFLVFFGGGRTPALLLTDKDGVPELTETPGGIQLRDVSRESVFLKSESKTKNGDSSQGAMLAAQGTFARELVLNKSNHWQVLDQYNASESKARIEGVAAINLDGQPGEEVVLVDTGIQKLRILRQEESLYRRWKEIDMGAFPFVSSHVADLNGDHRDDLVILGRSKFGVVYSGQANSELKRLASFESKIDKVYFADVAVGDLNGDEKTDLAVIDTRQHYVEILEPDSEAGLKHALQFKVFEEKSFSGSGAPGNEPRESLILDVTGDNRADLLLLTHDRILLYPQDTGR